MRLRNLSLNRERPKTGVTCQHRRGHCAGGQGRAPCLCSLHTRQGGGSSGLVRLGRAITTLENHLGSHEYTFSLPINCFCPHLFFFSPLCIIFCVTFHIMILVLHLNHDSKIWTKHRPGRRKSFRPPLEDYIWTISFQRNEIYPTNTSHHVEPPANLELGGLGERELLGQFISAHYYSFPFPFQFQHPIGFCFITPPQTVKGVKGS